MAARVLVMRPRAEAESVGAALAALGYTPVLVPILAIEPLAATMPQSRPDAVVMTSQHAANSLPDPLAQALCHLPVYAVGRATAAAARARGFAHCRIGAGDGADLADLVRLTLPAGAMLLHLAGRVHKTNLREALADAGYRVETCEVYDAREQPVWADAVAQAVPAHRIAGCLHYSRRSAALMLSASRGHAIEAGLRAAAHACLSADAATPLREAGLTHLVLAGEPTTGSLVQALARILPVGGR